MLTVVFDGACLGDGPVLGVGRAFLDGLAAYAGRGDADCVLLVPAGSASPALPGVRCVKAPRGALRRQLALPALLRRLHAHVLHSSVASVPLRSPCATVATVHDVPWLHPEAGERARPWRRFATVRALRAATAIVAPSAMTASDAATLLGGRTTKVHHVPHGTRRGEEPAAATTAARTGPLLVLGDDRPRKNRERVRAAHELARRRDASLPALRFVGPPDGWVDEAEKVRLLRACRAVVHCSLFEGFGLPVLEGLAHGAPVLCSDLPPHREIAQQHALFADPRSIEAIAQGLLTIHRDDAVRTSLALGGFARAACFDPAGVAEQWHRLHVQVAP